VPFVCRFRRQHKGKGFLSDEELLARAIQGDREAYGDLYERHLGTIYRYVYCRVGDVVVAEDLTEAVFLKVWRALPRFQVGRIPFRAWLCRVAHNAVVDHYRTRKEHESLQEKADLPDPLPSPEQRLIAKERLDGVMRAFRRLRPEYQEILALRFASGLSHEQAAQMMGRSIGAVRALQCRALQALQERVLEERPGRDDG